MPSGGEMVKKLRKNLTLCGVGLVGLIALVLCWPKSSEAGKAKQHHSPVYPVQVTTVSQQNIPQTVSAIGSLSAPEVVTISAQADGRISAIHFKDGQQVGEGMPIVQMANTKAQADYNSAVAAWKVAQTKYDRSKLLVNEAISQQDLAKLQADLESDHAAVQTAQAVLNDTQITAPFSGVLGSFSVSPGDYIKAGDPIVNLVNTEQLQVNFSLPENLKPKLQQGQLVEVTSSAYPKKTFYGTVSYISPTVDPDTRTIAIKASLPNKDNLLSPGMFVHADEQTDQIKDALVIPDNAVEADLKGYYVYKLQGDRAVQTYITEGQHITGAVQVEQGLKKGDVIVTAGQQKIEDGSRVKVLD